MTKIEEQIALVAREFVRLVKMVVSENETPKKVEEPLAPSEYKGAHRQTDLGLGV